MGSAPVTVLQHATLMTLAKYLIEKREREKRCRQAGITFFRTSVMCSSVNKRLA